MRRPPEDEHRDEVEQYQEPHAPRNQMAVVGQKLELEDEKHQNGRDRERQPSDYPQQAPQPTTALVRRTGKYLSEQCIGEALAYLGVVAWRRHGAIQHAIVRRCRAREQQYLDQHINMEGNEQDGRKEEESDQWQVDVQGGKLDGVFQQKLTVRYRTGRDDQVEAEDQKADPDR